MNRIIEIILSSLILDKIILEEKMEKIVTNQPNIEVAVAEAKIILRNMVLNEQMITKFQSMLKQPELPTTTKDNGANTQ